MKKLTTGFIVILLLGAPLLAAPPRVLVIPIENVSNDKNYDYIKPSVTDALLQKMREQFAFRETAPENLQAVAKDNNFLYEGDFYTRSVALQLGLLMRQDVVISGSFSISLKGKRRGEAVLLFNIFIQSVVDKKIVAEIQMQAAPDATIFEKINEISDRVVQEAGKVLPNKNDFSQKELQEVERIQFNNHLVLSGGTGIAINPVTMQTIPSSGSLSFKPGDFPLIPEIGLAYRRENFLARNLIGFAGASGSFGNVSKNLGSGDVSTKVTLISFNPTAGLGYKFNFWSRMYFVPMIGGGLYYGKANVNLSIANKKVEDASTGKEITEYDSTFYAPVVTGSAVLGVAISRNLNIELGGTYRTFFAKNQAAGDVQAFVGIAMGF